MHTTYSFHFLDTVSEQLCKELDALPVTRLDVTTLDDLSEFQESCGSRQGVYLMHLNEAPVYLGKADDVCERLSQHLTKLSGRKNISLSAVGYKALILDNSMSTAANEDVLIQVFRRSHIGMWNGKGFGPKDPGQERDTTKPSEFDKAYPIRDDFPISGISDRMLLVPLLKRMKKELPYVFRYSVPESANTEIDLAGVSRNSRAILQCVVTHLGSGWKGVVLSYGMILYETTKRYPFGDELLP